jgi:hypothetical protein
MRTSRLSILVMVLVIIALFAMICPAWGLGNDTPRTQKSGTSTGNWWTVNANSLTSGNLYLLQSTSTVAGGNIFAITSNTLTTGDFIQLTADDDALTSGKYINIFGASDHVTSVWSIGEGGATTITPPATTGVAKIPLYIDGTVLTTGDCLKLKAVSGTMTTGKALRVMDGTTETFAIGDLGDLQLTGVNAASGSANPFDYTGTLGIMNGSDDFTAVDINITNADHTGGSNTVQAIKVAAITGDSSATESAISVGSGWDFGLNISSPIYCSSTISGLRQATADEGDGSTTLTVAAYPSGSVITSGAATSAIVLPAVATSTGVYYTFVMKGATQFTLTGASACVMCDGQTAAKTNLVWSTTPLYLSISVISDGTNWMVTSMTTAPDSSS